MTIWYTADTHFSHKNILNHEQRPFASVEEMDEWLIDNWNRTASNEDTIYHLGDFVFGGPTKWEKILSRLKGKIHLVIGNHDDEKAIKRHAERFESVENMIVQKIDKQHLFLFHYPIEVGLTPNTYSIHGHIHSRPSTHINQINVGVDSLFTLNKFGFGGLIPQQFLLQDLARRKEEVMRLREESRNASIE